MKSFFNLKGLLFFTICIALIIVFNTDRDHSEKMLGQWYNESLKVIYDAQHGGDSTYNVPAGQWEERLQIRPIQTTYKSDGTYNSKYWNLQDSLIREVAGEWEVIGDTLYLTEGGVRSGYLLEFDGDRATFTAMYDWDGDGERDDLYSGVQIKK